ncbi:MAG: hypothetical protein M4579_002298 [Chaenotheca gracillima]|nr:MAG: hypothetical protein M4579_002298 [Chaenotheca gracillima]
MLQRALPSGRVPHVCVIGAGLAGLRCAEVLTKNGIKVTIVEGRDRIGGRIHQSNVNGHLVDLGPNWIHGTDSNPILDIARAAKSQLHSLGERQNIFDHDGKLLDVDRATECSDFLWSTIMDAFQYSNENSESIPLGMSLLDFFKKRLKDRNLDDASTPDEYLEGSATGNGDQQLLWTAEMWGAFIGDPISRQSLKYFWLEECIDGENLFIASTYKAVLDFVANKALASADLQLSKKVIQIKALEAESQVSIFTEGGTDQVFDEVVVTAPLGWLKGNQSAFEPLMEESLARAINSVSYGRLEKVCLTFPEAFWAESVEPTTNGNTQSQEALNSEEPIAFSHWMHPTYASSTNPDYWNQEAVNLAALPPGSAHPTLLFFIFGPCSTYITTKLSKLPESAHHDFLTDFFKPYYSRLPHFDSNSTNCTPVASQATSWGTDEFAGYGSYCNFQVGITGADQHVETMRKGMPERHIWLAGEHTAPFVALGTTTGAYWSGEGVAQRIIEAYGGSRQDEETYGKVKDKRKAKLEEEATTTNDTAR